MEAFGLPKKSSDEQEARKAAIETATLHAIQVPFEVMQVAFAGFEVAGAMAETGNPNSVSDAGVGALALYACIEGAWLNVKINAGDMKKHQEVQKIMNAGAELITKASEIRSRILNLVEEKISS